MERVRLFVRCCKEHGEYNHLINYYQNLESLRVNLYATPIELWPLCLSPMPQQEFLDMWRSYQKKYMCLSYLKKYKILQKNNDYDLSNW